jgi:hypothetical protein
MTTPVQHADKREATCTKKSPTSETEGNIYGGEGGGDYYARGLRLPPSRAHASVQSRSFLRSNSL